MKAIGQQILERVAEWESARKNALDREADGPYDGPGFATLEIMRWVATKWECPTCKGSAMKDDFEDLPSRDHFIKTIGRVPIVCPTCADLRSLLRRWVESR
jgi:hypothetical protein